MKRRPPATDREILSTLLQDVFELIARTEQATEQFEAITAQIPTDQPHNYQVERMDNASFKLSTARKELTKAYRRLEEHLGGGIVSQDLAENVKG